MWALVILLALYSWLTFSFHPGVAPKKVSVTTQKMQSRGLFRQLFKTEEGRKREVVVPSMSDSEAPESKGPEKKYVIAGIVTILAMIFDFYRMHGGVPFWAPGGVL